MLMPQRFALFSRQRQVKFVKLDKNERALFAGMQTKLSAIRRPCAHGPQWEMAHFMRRRNIANSNRQR